MITEQRRPQGTTKPNQKTNSRLRYNQLFGENLIRVGFRKVDGASKNQCPHNISQEYSNLRNIDNIPSMTNPESFPQH